MGLFYQYCKYNTRFTSHLFYENIKVSGAENIPANKPVLLLPSHPNSFLDAVLTGAFIPRPTYFLARGDAFNSKIANPILYSLNMLPVYRLSEGKENLGKNSETFDACHDILVRKQIVLMFPEGLSENNWDLRPLKKGPPRIAMKAWNSQSAASDLVVVPVGITYEHYVGGQKIIIMNIGKPFGKDLFAQCGNEAQLVKQFNEKVSGELAKLSYVNTNLKPGSEAHAHFRSTLKAYTRAGLSANEIIHKLQTEPLQQKPVKEYNFILYSLLFYPLYLLSKTLAPKIVKQPIFFDSISFGLFMFLWPLYLLLLGVLLNLIL